MLLHFFPYAALAKSSRTAFSYASSFCTLGRRLMRFEDLRESRLVVCDPAPIPLDEMQRTYDWLKSWGMLEETASPLELINAEVQNRAHQAAE